MNIALLKEMIAKDYVTVQKHPTHDLFIYNYTQKTQFERYWNEVTLMCRGLILDAEYRIVARPFQKFFNWGEIENQAIPNTDFEVFEKLDGSLGILYFIENEAFIATRGSFTGVQAVRATAILKSKYAPILRGGLDTTKTYLFEIIYPENRIVVDYGALEDLILTAIIDTETGADMPLVDIGFPIVQRYNGIKDFAVLKALNTHNKEGFVIKYPNGLRLKIKFEEYTRLHRILTEVSNINVWEHLCEGKSFEAFLDRVPDEFFNWIKITVADLEAQFEAIEKQCKADFKVLNSRKETAIYFMTCQYPKVLFNMLDNKPYAATIWKMLRPQYQKPFTNL